MQPDVPNPLYIFTNLRLPTVWHNLYFVGSFSSAGWSSTSLSPELEAKYASGTFDYLPFVPNEKQEKAFVSMHSSNVANDYLNEYNAELARRADYPTMPSRLSALYAFGDYLSCEAAARLYNWDLSTVMEYELIVTDAHTRVARLNMEVVSLMRLATSIGMIDPDTTGAVWKHYWEGGGTFSMELPAAPATRASYESGEIWEYLIEGRVSRIGGPLKNDPLYVLP